MPTSKQRIAKVKRVLARWISMGARPEVNENVHLVVAGGHTHVLFRDKRWSTIGIDHITGVRDGFNMYVWDVLEGAVAFRMVSKKDVEVYEEYAEELSAKETHEANIKQLHDFAQRMGYNVVKKSEPAHTRSLAK